MLLTFLAVANGGFIKLAEDNHLISVSLVPISASAGEKQTALISFVHNLTLIEERVDASVEVRKGGKKISSQKVFFTGVVASFGFVYPEEGIYEVFVEFAKESEPARVYAPEDFLVEVKNGGTGLTPELLVASAVVFAAGLAAGLLIRKR